MDATIEQQTSLEKPPEEKPPEEKAPDVVARSQKRMFEYSAWVHVGPGADDCEDVNEDENRNECQNTRHFHAWLRLPNQYQHREIRERALAGRARRARLLRDTESDAYVVLDDELQQIKQSGEAGRMTLVDEILNKDLWRDVMDVTNDLAEFGEEDEDRTYEHVRRDRERLAEIEGMEEDAQPEDERDELRRHLDAYEKDFEERMEVKIKPRREGLESQSTDELLDQIRGDRIERDAQEEFAHVYSTWMWLYGTHLYPRGPLVWADLKQMEQAAPEVLDELQQTYGDLERTHVRDAEGNL